MSEVNGLEYGVTIGTKHSINDWGLYLKSKPDVEAPEIKTVYVELPGADGVIDLTEYLTGDVKYDQRKITLTFTVIGGRNAWRSKYSDIADYIHGQNLKVILDEDPCYYYTGRLELNKWESSKYKATITIEGEMDPYKYELYSSLENWLWDPFNFEDGIIREYKDIEVNGVYTLIIPGRRKEVSPIFILESGRMTMTYGGATYTLSAGENRVSGLTIGAGEHKVIFSGKGVVSVDYRGGRL